MGADITKETMTDIPVSAYKVWEQRNPVTLSRIGASIGPTHYLQSLLVGSAITKDTMTYTLYISFREKEL